MTRLASILLALFCLFTAASGGGEEGWRVISSLQSYAQTVIATKDMHFLVAHEFSETRRAFLVSRNHPAAPRHASQLETAYLTLETGAILGSWIFESCVFSATAPHGWDIRFAYDAEGRRCKKTVTRKTTENNKTAVTREETYFAWDDWNPIYERHENQFGTLLWDRENRWGEDLAGGAPATTMQWHPATWKPPGGHLQGLAISQSPMHHPARVSMKSGIISPALAAQLAASLLLLGIPALADHPTEPAEPAAPSAYITPLAVPGQPAPRLLGPIPDGTPAPPASPHIPRPETILSGIQ